MTSMEFHKIASDMMPICFQCFQESFFFFLNWKLFYYNPNVFFFIRNRLIFLILILIEKTKKD